MIRVSTLTVRSIADALEFAFLQDPQELDLELGRGAVHLVEKNAPGVRSLEPAGPVVDRAGERALDVAEELAFEQALGECSAVDADVRAGEPRAEVVDGTGDQLLARARFSDDQHTCARRGDLPGNSHDLAHRRARADQAREADVVSGPRRVAVLGVGHFSNL